MSGSFNGVAVRHTRIGPSGTITYPFAGGWTIFFMFQPKSTQSEAFPHLYSHAESFMPQDAINIYRHSASGQMLCRVETAAQTPLDDKLTSNNMIAEVWNAFALTWDGVNFNQYMNGTQTVHAPGAGTATYTPPDQVSIGIFSDLAVGMFNGDICHVSQLSRPLTSGEGQKYTDVLVSPRFAQNSLEWHCPIWNSDFNFDEQQVKTVTATSMVYSPQAPAKHPCKSSTNVDDLNLVPVVKRRAYFFIG